MNGIHAVFPYSEMFTECPPVPRPKFSLRDLMGTQTLRLSRKPWARLSPAHSRSPKSTESLSRTRRDLSLPPLPRPSAAWTLLFHTQATATHARVAFQFLPCLLLRPVLQNKRQGTPPRT